MSASTFSSNAASFTRMGYAALLVRLFSDTQKRHDEALASHDLLLMPTLPIVATKLPEENAPISEILQRGFEMLPNTAPFDCTHHPAMSVPCGLVDELPAGMMLVGRQYAEGAIYQAAAEFEAKGQWRSLTA